MKNSTNFACAYGSKLRSYCENGLNGNAVRIGNSSRCCKFQVIDKGKANVFYIPDTEKFPALFATGHNTGREGAGKGTSQKTCLCGMMDFAPAENRR